MGDLNDSPRRERGRSGKSVWPWVLGLIGLGVLLLLVIPAIMSDVPSRPTVGVGGSPEDTAITDIEITTLDDITRNPDQSSLENSLVILTSVPVQQVLTDRLFFVGTGNQRLLVFNSGPTTEDINVGDQINISGRIQKLPAVEQIRQMWNPDDGDLPIVGQQEVYIDARTVSI